MNDYPISQLRIVTLSMRKQGSMPATTTTHMCHVGQVEQLVKASVKLHHGTGNPHTGRPLDNLWEIRVQKLKVETVSYWWCCEDLQRNHSPAGAQLNEINHGISSRVWAHPELLTFEREKARQEEEEEYRDGC